MPTKVQKNNESLQPDLFDVEETVVDDGKRADCAVMYCDGASSGNPGKSGIGVVIYLSDEDADCLGGYADYSISEYIGIATNNIAEYTALIKGLKKLNSLGVSKIKVYLDSELVVKQINGVYKVKNSNLIPLWNEAQKTLKDFDSYKITHVRRELNKEADKLATEAVKKSR